MVRLRRHGAVPTVSLPATAGSPERPGRLVSFNDQGPSVRGAVPSPRPVVPGLGGESSPGAQCGGHRHADRDGVVQSPVADHADATKVRGNDPQEACSDRPCRVRGPMADA